MYFLKKRLTKKKEVKEKENNKKVKRDKDGESVIIIL
jgi:hypothetical protein